MADGAVLGVNTVQLGGFDGAVMTLRNGAQLLSGDESQTTVGDNATFRYGGTGNYAEASTFWFQAADSLLQKEPEIATAELDLRWTDIYTVQTDQDHFSGWDASGVLLHAGRGGGTTTLEVTYGDFGGIFFVDVGCVPYREFIVGRRPNDQGGALVVLRNDYPNGFHGLGAPPGFPEALYVNGDVTVGADSTLDLNGINLYYTGTLTLGPNALVIGGVPVQVRALNYGDFDEDCDVDLADYLIFQQHYTGSGEETDWPPADGDCDKDVDQADYLKFQLNFTGSLPGCDAGEGGNTPSGGDERFTGSLVELAGWSWSHLSERQRVRLAERLETVIRTGQGGDQTDQITALARMLR